MMNPADALLVSSRFLHHPPPQAEPWQQSLENYAARKGLIDADQSEAVRQAVQAEREAIACAMEKDAATYGENTGYLLRLWAGMIREGDLTGT